MEPSSSIAGGAALAKLIGWPVVIGAVTAALGMLLLWPRALAKRSPVTVLCLAQLKSCHCSRELPCLIIKHR